MFPNLYISTLCDRRYEWSSQVLDIWAMKLTSCLPLTALVLNGRGGVFHGWPDNKPQNNWDFDNYSENSTTSHSLSAK